MPAPRPPFIRPGVERAVLWLSLFGLLIILALFTLLVARDREDLAAEATDRAETQALLLTERTARLFDAAELALSIVIAEQGMDHSLRLLHDRLAGLAERLPYVEAFWLHGPSGLLRLTSLVDPPPPSDASDKDFFIRHKEGSVAGVHVSDAAGTGTERATFRISHRIENGKGSFLGVASVTMEVRYLSEFFRSQPLPQGGTASLLRAPDLAPLVCEPPPLPGQRLPGVERLPAAIRTHPEEGLFRAVSPHDGIERIVAYRKVAGFPLYVTVTVPLTSVRGPWLELIALRSAEAGAAMLILTLLTTLALREARHQRMFQETLENRVAARTAELELAVQEVHHRVRNNLQVVGALLTMQAARVSDESVRAALSESIGRVHTISLVHQTLYGTGAVTELPFGDYLRDLAGQLGDLYEAAGTDIQVTGDNPVLPLETAVPLALIVHEALSNALKHAFPAGSPGRVTVTLSSPDGHGLELTIADTGVGLSHRRHDGLGMKIMRSLAAQVGATLEVASDGGGTRVVVALEN